MYLDDQRVYSKLQKEEFPAPNEVEAKVGEILAAEAGADGADYA